MNYSYIKQISTYEVKLFTRNIGFKITVFFCVCLVLFLHLITHSNLNHPQWMAISLPSSIPYANAWLVNYLQILLLLIWSGRQNPIKQKQDTFDSISVRPYSNCDFLCGKLLGCWKVILTFDFVCMGIAIFIHLFASDSPFALYPYLFYYFTLTLPSLIFLSGLVVSLQIFIKPLYLLLPVCLGILYLNSNYATNHLYHLTDLFMADSPNLFSDIDGFPELSQYLQQRLSFLLWGCGLLSIGLYAIKRNTDKPQKHYRTGLTGLFIIVCGFLPATFCFYHFDHISEQRQLYREIFLQYEDIPKVQIDDHKISFQQENDTYKASSILTINNPTDQVIPKIILYLNPGLQITSITEKDTPLNFKRDHQVISISDSLPSRASRVIKLEYEGGLSPDICYSEITEIQEEQKKGNYSFLNPGHKYFYLRPDYTLLTPECLWYPNAQPPVIIKSPYNTPLIYTHFELTVYGETDRRVISQGEPQQHKDTIQFTHSYKLPGLSLCIGPYIRKAIEQDGVVYELWFLKGHEYLVETFKGPEEVMGHWKLQLDYSEHIHYNFKKSALIETPIHFHSFSRYWKDGSEFCQPELIFRPEREAWLEIPLIVKKPESNSRHIVESPEASLFSRYFEEMTIPVRMIKSQNLFLYKLFGRAETPFIQNEYDISDLLKKHQFSITSTEFKGINRFFQTMDYYWNDAHKGYVEYPANLESLEQLTLHSFEDILLSSTQYDERTLSVFMDKCNYFLRYLMCFVPYSEVYSFHENFLNEYSHRTTSYEEYCSQFNALFGINLADMTRELFTSRGLTSFVLGEVKSQPVDLPDAENQYLQTVKIWNRGKTTGLISLAGYHLHEKRHYLIPAGSAKEIRILYTPETEEETTLEVNTSLAQNIPTLYRYELTAGQPTKDIRTGLFDLDTTLFLPGKNEYIVDNEDPGFRIIENNQPLKKFFRKETTSKSQSDRYSPIWTRYYAQEAYGYPIRSYYSRLSGEGNTKIKWEITLREAGEYEVFIYNNDFAIKYGTNYFAKRRMENLPAAEPIQTYSFRHAEGEESIALETKEVGSGWISLGSFLFEAGSASITLSDQGADKHQIIQADAAKWVKIDN